LGSGGLERARGWRIGASAGAGRAGFPARLGREGGDGVAARRRGKRAPEVADSPVAKPGGVCFLQASSYVPRTRLTEMSSEIENLIIVGTGCAGLTAAIYSGRANLNPLLIEGILPG